MSAARVVLHVDMDAFYASVEQHDDPRLAGLPVIVGGNGPRGVVAAASYEVRKFGVRSAMPMRQALERCPQAVCVRPRMARYQEVSRLVFAIFNEFTPLVQGLSLDEAFLDVSANREPVAQIAAEIKRRIRARTGLTASVGAAANQLVAKIASDLNKPDGLTLVTPQTLRGVLDPSAALGAFGVGDQGPPAGAQRFEVEQVHHRGFGAAGRRAVRGIRGVPVGGEERRHRVGCEGRRVGRAAGGDGGSSGGGSGPEFQSLP